MGSTATIETGVLETHDNDELARIAFEAGDYSKAYQLAHSPVLKGCCLIMLGCFEEGLVSVSQATDACSLFCSAVAYWGLGNKVQAIARLLKIDRNSKYFSAAEHLIKVLHKPHIKLLFQGRDDPSTPAYDIAGAFRSLSYVDIKTMGYSNRSDIVIKPYTTFAEIQEKMGDWEPDIFLSHMIEDHPPPIGIENARFMTFCHTQDYDRHFHQCYHYLRLFDAIVSLGSVDHDDLARITGKRVFVFPMLLGLNSKIDPLIEFSKKDIDIYISGTLFNNNDEKSRYIYQLSQLAQHYRIVLSQGFTSESQYYESLRRAKCTFTYVNRWGLINGRAIEAIGEGCCALYQEGGELGIFLKPQEGAIPYNPDNLQLVVKDVLDNWNNGYALSAMRGAKKVRNIFNIEQGISRYLIMLLVNAALLNFRKQTTTDSTYNTIRYVNRSPHRIPYSYDNNPGKLYELQKHARKNLANRKDYAALDAVAESYLYSYISLKKNIVALINEKALSSIIRKIKEFGLKKLINLGSMIASLRRILLNIFELIFKYAILIPAIPVKYLWIDRSISCYKGLTKNYPDHIAAYFNLARLYYAKRKYKNALITFKKIIDSPNLNYFAEDMLFWREFYDEYFDYDRMMRESVEYRRAHNPAVLLRIKEIIIESCLCYIVNILDMENRSKEAFVFLKNFNEITTGLPRLAWYQFKLEVEYGQAQVAVGNITQFFNRKPWYLLSIGEDIFKLAELRKIELNHLRAQYDLLRSRMNASH